MDAVPDCPPGTRPSRWVVLGGTAGILVLVAGTVLGQHVAPPRSAWLLTDVVVGGLAVAAVPLLFRRPVPTAMLLGGLAALSPAATPVATMAVLLVAAQRRLAVAIGVAAVSLAGHAVQGAVRRWEGLSYGWWLLLAVVAHAALVGIGAAIRARAAVLESLRLRAQRAEEQAGRRVAEARAAERARMAREMHDVLAHRLSLVATYAGALEYRADLPEAQRAQAVSVIRSGVQDALDELRGVIAVLREDPEADDGVRPQPTVADLPRLLEESRQAGTGVVVDGSLTSLDGLPAGSGRTAYRLVQEGLTNARKHAPGEPVRLSVSGTRGGSATIELRNPTRGGRPAVTGSGTGLLGMTERVRLAGGRLDHGVRDGEFVVRATLPWPT